MLCCDVSAQPLGPLAINVTVFVCRKKVLFTYWWDGLVAMLEVPSPKSHWYPIAPTLLFVKLTSNGAQPGTALLVNRAITAGDTVISMKAVSLHPKGVLAMSMTVNTLSAAPKFT